MMYVGQCSWGAEGAKKPSAIQYVESLKKRIRALETYARELKSKVDNCRCEQRGVNDVEPSESILQARPDIYLPGDLDLDSDSPEPGSDTDNELLYPTSNLVLEDRDLLFHGTTSIFRHSTPQRMSRFPEIIENHKQCYVLMVEGGDQSHYNPNFDWSRYLPTAVPLDRREHDRILDCLFKFFTSWCLRIVPALFLRDMWRALSVPVSQTPPKTSHYSPMLHNALIALASAFSDDPRVRDLKARRYFASEAKSYIDAECQMPNICVVHALSILASFHSAQGEQTLGYTYFGERSHWILSVTLGLGVDCSTWVEAGIISRDDRLDRNWGYWTTFSQDVCWSLYVGRDFCVPCPTNRENIPVPYVETDLDELPWHHAPSNIAPQAGYLSKTFAASCELLLIARPIMDVVNSLGHTGKHRTVRYELVSEIDVKLNAWKDALAQELDITQSNRGTATPHKIMLHLAHWWLFILLHRPFYRRPRPIHSSEAEIDHVKLCNRAAEHSMELLSTWRSLYGLRYAPITLVQVIFSAGTVYLLSAVQATSGVRVAPVSLKHSLDHAELCMQYLSECGRSWECANKIGEILRSLLMKQLEPRLQRRNISVNTSFTEGNGSTMPRRTPSKRARRESKSARSRSTGSPQQRRSSSRRTPTQTSPSSSKFQESPTAIKETLSPETSPSMSSFPVETTPSGQGSFVTFEWPYPAPVGVHQPSAAPPAPPEDEDEPMSYSMSSSGFLGMPGGERLSEQPFISFEVDENSLFDGLYGPSWIVPPDLPPLDLTEADFLALQQLFEPTAPLPHNDSV
ncbi:hypothetical protein PC9H_000474 [Pleurotus ostreatus]|uniref:Xylanolytic transcriptional activator regulatory domain-containing protein n=1 Tax=Pleurotus ostreatus TaxID=5322 RepID=A0A8H7A8N7_PLEOS|nr:uncharacterized protein PC9H_000474 [Pleurotus ostreatus]KAF7440130.1 hypothetical protein PC9H_000474 [Pleurotus ostreatus]